MHHEIDFAQGPWLWVFACGPTESGSVCNHATYIVIWCFNKLQLCERLQRVSASRRVCTDVMTSSQRDVAVSRLTSLLHEWDSGSKSVRQRILQEFVAQNQQRRTAPELDAEFADAASLFFTRLTSWLRLSYPPVSLPYAYAQISISFGSNSSDLTGSLNRSTYSFLNLPIAVYMG